MLARPSLRTTLAALLGTVALASAHASAQLRPVDAYYEGAAAPQRFAGRIPEGLAVLGRDDRRGAPTLLVGRTAPRAGGRAEVAAAYLLALAPSYGLSARDLSSVVARDFRPTRAGGTFVVFTQVVAGVPVVGARLSLLIDRRGALVAAGGQLFGTEPSYAFARDEALGARDAIEAELAPIATGPSPSLVTAGRGVDGHLRFLLPPSGAASGYALDRAVRAYRVLYPLPQRLAPAIYAELWMPDGGELIAYAIDATDGSVLMRRSLTESDAFDYRVYADATSPFTPVDSVFGDTTPDPAGMPVRGIPAYAMSGLVSVEGINTNPTGLPDPWLPAGASDTRGNNVDAYADLGSPDGFSSGDLRASTTAPGAFEHMYDPLTAPDANGGQRQAAITQLFFTTNWLHDYFYDQGFDEAAGNAQEDTLGRGGVGGDRMNAEAMDYSGRNNANMSTPADGSNPRMQMYLWTGYNEAGVEQGGVTYAVGTAGFGPTEFDVTAPTRVVVDGTAPADDGCQAITNDLTGTIALVERGACSFVQKVSNATAAGALGVIVINNVSPGTITLGGTSTTMTPSLMVALEDGADIRAVEGMMARIFRTQRPDVPSSFDAQVVTHEWGHYLHHRLESFGQLQGRAMSEGWADFISLLALVRPSDDLTGAFPAASWSAQGSDPVYFGTRRVPYSQNRSFNALSFRHISRGEPLPTSHPVGTGPSDNAEIHNAGEIWSTMMFDALVKLLEYSRSSAATYTFEEARDRMAQYVVTGMQLTPNDATYTEQRDAIIAAALENDADDAQRIALAFAGRGAGSCAVSPTRASNDLTGVIEHFALAPRPSISAIDVVAEGLGLRCDADATLDAGEDGTVRVTVRNDGITALAGASVTVSSDATALSFPSGATQAVPTLAAGTDLTLTFAVHLDAAASLTGPATFVADLSASGLCGPVSSSTRAVLDRDGVRVDTEDFEATPTWLSESSLDGMTLGVWTTGPSALGDPDHVLRGIDSGGVTDTAVELPDVTVSATDPLVLTFEHRFDFEASPTVWWDGGVIEVSRDGGGSWLDVGDFVSPGYSGVISNTASSPLADRPAYSGRNPSYPGADVVALDFGMTFASETIRFRFRIGTDEATSGPGWEIDDVTITGVMPPAFDGFGADAADCVDAPTADAGPDQTVRSGDLVMLDGSASSDPNGDTLTFAWTPDDTSLALSDPAIAMPTFTAPLVTEPTSFAITLLVSDGTGSSSDEVIITVEPPEMPMPDAGPIVMPGTDAGPGRTDAGPFVGTDGGPRPRPDGGVTEPDAGDGMDDGGCACRAGMRSRGVATPWALMLLAAVVFVRRRRR